MSLEVVTVMHPQASAETASQQEELVRRVATSVTFEKSPRLRAFLIHVCRCAIENKSEEATEQQIAIYVYGRPAGYNSNDDNIVRSQARMLRMKLEHHFDNEGKGEPVVITIPKGQYLPVFENRLVELQAQPGIPPPFERKVTRSRGFPILLAVLGGIMVVLLGYLLVKSRANNSPSPVAPPVRVSQTGQREAAKSSADQRIAAAASAREIRIAAGRTGAPYVDAWGNRWESDRYFVGGVDRPGPAHLFPPVGDEGLFKSMREAVSDNSMVPESERGFQYNIPAPSGVYELRLYFADPLRETASDQREDGQNQRHFQVKLNRHPLLVEFDPVADAGYSAIDVRVFKDVYPDTDGKIHLEFLTDWGRAFVSAIELTPGIPGKLTPIRIAAGRSSDLVGADGIRWNGDRDFIDGRTWVYQNPSNGPILPPIYSSERDGNFSYSIPAAPGKYTVRLHFLESFFSPVIPAAFCHGTGCRVFDVSCNGRMLLHSFDISQAAGGPFRPVIREFHGLEPNGQGKLLLSFSPTVNYAEVRAIEVIDEAK